MTHSILAAKKEGSGKKSVKKEGSDGGVEGDPEFVDLGNKRRASISEFKGRKLLNLREYYEKDGQVLTALPIHTKIECECWERDR